MQLIVENLVQLRAGRKVIDRLSFKVAGGEALVLTGPNGAGKTTLLRTLAGFLAPADGTLALQGAAAGASIAEQAHFIGHLNGLKPNLTAGENLAFWSAFLSAGASTGSDSVASIDGALDAFSIAELKTIPVGFMSAGQKRRVALARLLVAKRLLWFLDEPTASLDAASSKLLANAVEEHLRLGGIVIAATHLPLGLARAAELQLGLNREAA